MNKLTRLWVILIFSLLPFRCEAELTLNFQLHGLTGDALVNTQNRLQILKESFGKKLSSDDIHTFYQEAPANIQEALKPFGYFKPTIYKHIYQQGQQAVFDFSIDLGHPIYITHVNIQLAGEGKDNIILKNIVRDFPLKPGQVLVTPIYEKAKKQLFNSALEEGYLSAYFSKQEILVNLKKNSCIITLILNTESRYYFGPVSFNNIYLSTDLLKRYMPFKVGDPFSAQKLADFQNVLSNSNYFKSVSVENTVPQKFSHQIPVSVNLSMKKARKYLLGIGYGTDTGPRITANANYRYINPEGHYINFLLIASPVLSSLQASYFIPGEHPATDKYSLNAGLTSNSLNQGKSITGKIGINQIRLLENNWQRTLSLDEEVERFKFNNQAYYTSYLLIPGIRLFKLSSNNPVFPTEGNRFSIRLEAGPPLGIISPNAFIQAEIQDKYITHFTDNDRIILRGDLGYTATQNLDTFPLSHRFYAGGSQSVRGYAYQSLGPGQYLLVTSAEFQERIKDKWYGAIFYDAGNAADTLKTPLKSGAGIGLVWASPIGTMELTVAKALSVPGQPNRIQFTMGADL